jgi:hypothetical protein
MKSIELLEYSLGTALGILEQVTTDLTQEQVDWNPPGTANSIGSLYWHANAYVDFAVHDWGMGQVPLSQKDGWRDKVLVSPAPDLQPGDPPVMQDVQVDLPALQEYAKAVQRAAQDWVASLTSTDLERKIETPVGELTLAQMLELYIIWHVNVHSGEIAALKGCRGVKGYPF